MGQVSPPLEGISAGDSDIERANITEVNNIDDVEDKTKSTALGESATVTADVIDIPLNIDALETTFQLTECLRSNGIEGLLEEDYPSSLDAKYQSPFAWPLRKKITVLFGTFFASTLAAYSAGAYAMAAVPLTERWTLSNTEFNLGITLFVLGFGFAPMILALISEIYGRYWVFVGSGAVFFLGTLGCAVTQSFPGMLVSRLITGNGASVFATLTGGVVGDVFHKENRNTPMALYSLTIMIGTGLGPMISGIIVDNLHWRWIFYLQMITVGSTTLAIFFFFAETRSNVVLERKCVALNKYFDGIRLQRVSSSVGDKNGLRQGTELLGEGQSQPVRVQFRAHVEGPELDMSIIWRSFSFPLKLLCTESVVFWFSAWVSFAWAILYMQFNSIGLAFRSVYGFNSSQVGGIYTSVIVGSIIGAMITIFQEPIFKKVMPQRMATPEGRLYSACVESLFLPIGLFWFGWSSSPDVPWIAPALAITSVTVGIFTIYLAVFNYLADTYHRYASSALAAQSMCRNLLAGVFPLFTNIMFQKLGYGVQLTPIISCLILSLGAQAAATSGTLEKRDTVTLGVFHDGGCAGSFTNNFDVSSGRCQDFSGNVYGAVFLNRGRNVCKLKFWANAGCSGKATVSTVNPDQDHSCVAVANKDGQFYLADGARSVYITC
ncbi:major facilitator superfamily domain-containing protein [Colletotrichum godetiae]|uniref:Major facilitator superfamily domain-containing protein n=1 Tax=Colletotrichum godetiae TaxID=1209918 RepID=A0AAJ0ETH0_9PEZI|nr:major facilitator superfamily domain-containing protein [Colletotrichum godetiae]KAK1676191.1 major facilitator superfamily domain-containing protein [Colletotrichum godetiae]